jgi:hypothetical protein
MTCAPYVEGTCNLKDRIIAKVREVQRARTDQAALLMRIHADNKAESHGMTEANFAEIGVGIDGINKLEDEITVLLTALDTSIVKSETD